MNDHQNYRKKVLVQFARENRSHPTKAEGLFWNVVARRKRTGYRILRQYPITANIILDFYCPKLKLAIEINGSSHNKEAVDYKREQVLYRLGIVIVYFENEQVISSLHTVYSVLVSIMQDRARLLENKKNNPKI